MPALPSPMRDLLPYFAAVGVSHLYASPIMTARPGSTHGYDTIDPTRVNPELGGEEGLRRLVAELRRHEMGLIVDIVPHPHGGRQRKCLVDGGAGTRARQPLRPIFRHRLGAGRPASARQGAVADPRPAI